MVTRYEIKIWTIGGYGTHDDSFFGALREAEVEILIDTRRRAGMRGKSTPF